MILKMCLFSRKSLYLTLISLIIGSVDTFSQCPTVTTPTQTFCDVQAPIIADLVAVNNGNGVTWYATAASTTALGPSIGLMNGEDYYADDNSGTCGARQRVDVIIYRAPTGLNFQGVCVDDPMEANIADLVANGNDIRWYSSQNGGTALPPTTLLTDNTIYYADQSNPFTGCRTSRLSVFVNVGVVPVPIGDAIQEFCADQQPPPTVADLIASGTNNNWYNTISSALPLDPSTPLVDGATYFATTVDPPCESVERLQVQVVFNTPNDPGSNGNIDICEPNVITTQTVNLFDGLNGTPMTGGVWSGPFPTTNGSTGTVDITTMTVSGSPYVFSYTVDASPGCTQSSATVSVNIIAPPNAGTNGSVTFCGNGAAEDLFASLGGTPDTGGTWSPALASGTGQFDPNVDPAGTYTYTATATSPCVEATATVTVTIIPPPNAGTNGAVTFCENSSPTDLFASLGGTPDLGGTWSPALASGTGLFDPNVDPVGIYTYTVIGTPPCLNATATVTVSILPPPNAGTNGAVTFCGNGAAEDLFTSLGGTSDTGGNWSPALASGTGLFDPNVDPAGTYTYTVTGTPPCNDATATVTVTIIPPPNAGTNGAVTFCETSAPTDLFASLGGSPDLGGTWSPALASGTGLFDPNVDPVGIYTYTVIGMPPCLEATATVTVSILPPPNAGTNGAVTYCGNGAAEDLFASLGGTPETGGIWSPALASGTGLFDPNVDPAGTYTYTVTGTPPCNDATATVTVTLIPPPNAGTNGAITFCETSAPTDLFASLGGTPDLGGTWSPALASGTGLFDPNVDPVGIYTYTVIGTPPCLDATATVTVSILPPPNAGTNGAVTFCGNGAPEDLFASLGGTPDTGGTWSPALASGTGLFDPNVDPAGTYTYTVTGTPPCNDATATVTVTLIPPPNAGTNGAVTFCENSAPTDLFASLGGTPDLGGTWSPALASGTGLFDPNVDPVGIYTYTVIGTPPCLDATATVTVSILPPPNAGTNGSVTFCGNGAAEDLFASLGGTPDTGGTWSPALASGTGLFDPNVDPAGIYTYTVTGTPPCNDATASVTVTIIPPPNSGTNGALQICESGLPEDLFNSLGGTPDSGGIWSPSLSSGTGLFDPLLDNPGTYTYTITAGSCTASSTVVVTEVLEPNAGSDGTITFCSNGGAMDLFNSLGGTPDAGGTWSPSLASGTGLFDPSIDTAGMYTYTVDATSPCRGSSSATITVSINQEPNVTGALLSSESVCLGLESLVTISNANQLADGTYTITYELSGANVSQNNTVTADFVGGSASFAIPETLLINPGTTTITISQLTSVTTQCGADVTGIVAVQFEIFDAPTPSLITAGNKFCLEDDPTIQNLSANIVDTQPITWYDAPLNGTAYQLEEPLIDGLTYYASLMTSDGCESLIRLAVTVTVERCEELVIIIPDGFSPNDDDTNDDFNILNIRELFPNFTLEIFNRYGNVLYKGNTNTPNWDGTSTESSGFGNSKVPVGVYFFILEFNDGVKEPLQGRVYLSR